MKKTTIILLLSLLCSFVAKADLSQKALNMRSQIKSYLNTEGYSPSIDSDGDIAFTYDGGKFYVHFQDYKDKVAVSIVKYLKNDTDLSHSSIDKLCWSIDSDYMLVKVYPNTSYSQLKIEAEALYDNASQFKQFFFTNIVIVDLVTDELIERVGNM